MQCFPFETLLDQITSALFPAKSVPVSQITMPGYEKHEEDKDNQLSAGLVQGHVAEYAVAHIPGSVRGRC